MKYKNCVHLIKGNIKGEVFIFSDDGNQTGEFLEIIKIEIGDLHRLHNHDYAIYFFLMPDDKYKSFDEFIKWFSNVLLERDYQQHKDFDNLYVRQ